LLGVFLWLEDVTLGMRIKFKDLSKKGVEKGFGKNYKPWLKIQDVPSHGRSSGIQGWKTERTHHFLSDHEKYYFYLLEWSDVVIDIREQFPLLGREIVQQIAVNAGIEHPKDKETQTPLVVRTDFFNLDYC
jgi:TnsA endonuclease N terminal